MTTHKINQVAIRTGFDVAHLAITILLAATSWAALYGGLAEKFTFAGAIVIMLLVNIAFDGFPFILGCYVSGELGKENEDNEYEASENLWVVAAVAMILHIGSGIITFSGANLIASRFSKGEEIAGLMQSEESRIQAQNQTATLNYNQAVKDFEKSKNERLKRLADNHNAAVARLQEERLSMQRQNYPRNASLIAQKITSLEKSYQDMAAKIQSENHNIQKPRLESPGNYAAALKSRMEEDQKTKSKIAFALKFTDVCSLVIMALWFVVLFVVPGIAGASNLVIWLFGWAFTLAVKVSQKAVAYDKLLQANSDAQLYAQAEIEENAIRHLAQMEAGYEAQLAEKAERMAQGYSEKLHNVRLEMEAEWEREKKRVESEWEKRVAWEKSEWEREKSEWERQKSEWKSEREQKASEGNPASIGREARVEKASEKTSGASEKARENPSGKTSGMKKTREKKREIRDLPVLFEDVEYKNLLSFEGSMRKAKSDQNREKYLRMKAYYNELLGIEAEIKMVS